MNFRTLLRPALLACPALLAASAPVLALDLGQLPDTRASASSCYLNAACTLGQDWAPDKVLDGLDYDVSGRYSWSAGTFGSAAAPAWVRLDFGAVYALDGVELRFTYNRGAFANQTNVYELRTSVDGGSWSVAAAGTLIDSADPALLNNNWQWAGGTQPLARYVEYRVVGGSHWAALGELRVQGQPAAVPEPATLLMWALGAAGLLAARRMRAGERG